MSCLFAERSRQLFYKKGDNSTEYPISKEQDRVTGYWVSPIGSEGGQGNLTPGSYLNLNNLPKGVNEDEHWDVDGAIDAESAQCADVNRKVLGMQDECQTKNRRFPTNVSVVVELTEESPQLADALVYAVPSSVLPAATGRDATELTVEVDKAKAFINTVTVCQY